MPPVGNEYFFSPARCRWHSCWPNQPNRNKNMAAVVLRDGTPSSPWPGSGSFNNAPSVWPLRQ